MEDGSLAYDGVGWLKDTNGNYILDAQGNRKGAQSVQKGLENILDISSEQAVKILLDQKFELRKDGSYWTHSGNANARITLGNAEYKKIYEQSLDQHNTLTIYNNLVAGGHMDMNPQYVGLSRGLGSQIANLTFPSPYISYEEYKSNNFIQGVGYNMLQLNKPEGRITSQFGIRNNPFSGTPGAEHTGVDVSLVEGTGILPMATGVVDYVGYDSSLGNMMVLRHNMSYTFKGQQLTRHFFTDYLHLRNNTQALPDVIYGVGTNVTTATLMAYSGNTGPSTGPHLHTGVFFQMPAFDPYANWLRMQGNQNFMRTRGNRTGVFFNPELFW